MTKRKRMKGQPMMYKILHRKLKIKQHDPIYTIQDGRTDNQSIKIFHIDQDELVNFKWQNFMALRVNVEFKFFFSFESCYKIWKKNSFPLN
jgi:hypothetical protein